MTALKKILLSKKVYRNGLLKLDKRKDSKVGCNCSSSARTEVYKADQPGLDGAKKDQSTQHDVLLRRRGITKKKQGSIVQL